MVIGGGWGGGEEAQLTTLKLGPFISLSNKLSHIINNKPYRCNSQMIFFSFFLKKGCICSKPPLSLHFPKVCNFISVSEVLFPRRDFRKLRFRLQ